MTLGVALIATIAGGNLPGGAAGAVLVANASIGAATATVSGITDVVGSATSTNVERAQKALAGTGNLGALVVSNATGGNLDAGKVAGTLTSMATLSQNPAGALKNPATIVKAGLTINSGAGLFGTLFSSIASALSGVVAPQAPAPAPPPPPAPQGSCPSGICR